MSARATAARCFWPPETSVRVLLEQICNAELLRERQKLRLHLREMLARQNERQKNIILQG